jgi:hypothetical protein
VATVNAEILIIRQDDGVGEGFAHAHQTSIGKAHGDVAVLLYDPKDLRQVFIELESDGEGTAAK